MIIILAEPNFWQSVVLDMIVHPHPRPLSWGTIIAVAVIVGVVGALHEVPVMLIRRLFRLAATSKAPDREANQAPLDSDHPPIS